MKDAEKIREIIEDNTLAPLVSVVVQTYRHEKFIRSCLESVLIQEVNFKYELIIGVDISEDKTEEICQEYKNKYPDTVTVQIRNPVDKIILFGQPIGRFNFHQNLLSAKGKYIAILDGDDYWIDKQKLQIQVSFLENRPDASVCFTKWKIQESDRIYTNPRIEAIETSKNEPYEVNSDNFYKNFCATTGTCMFRRDLLNIELIKKNPTTFQDTFLFYSLVMQKPGYLLPEKTSVYRLHAGGVYSMQPAIRRYRASTWTLRAMVKTWPGQSIALQERYYRMLKLYLYHSVKSFKLIDVLRATRWILGYFLAKIERGNVSVQKVMGLIVLISLGDTLGE
jgi:glycosyltransferase involved in cell wall biosynthesis